MARFSSLFTTTLDLIPLVGDIDNASVLIELTRLCRIYVCVHTHLRRVDNTERLAPSVNHADLSIIFAQAHNVPALLSLCSRLPTLKTIVTIGGIPTVPKELLNAWSRQRGIRVITFEERKCFL